LEFTTFIFLKNLASNCGNLIELINRMKHIYKTSLLTIAALVASHSFANEIRGLTVTPPQATPGTQVSFIIESAKASPSSALWCGINIDFGNGNSSDIRLGQNGDADLRYTFLYTYPSPGTYTATVSGKGLTRGLKSAVACFGAPQRVSIRIVDPEVIRMQMEIERNKRDQAIREQVARETADKIARETAEKVARDREISDRLARESADKQKLLDAQKKEQEAEAKTQELERKIRELEQAKSKPSTPQKPSNPTTAPKSEPKEDSAPPAKKGKADSIL